LDKVKDKKTNEFNFRQKLQSNCNDMMQLDQRPIKGTYKNIFTQTIRPISNNILRKEFKKRFWEK